ncbi:MAG: hypothetical protein ABI592_13210 [Acidobacteriota bacterium]
MNRSRALLLLAAAFAGACGKGSAARNEIARVAAESRARIEAAARFRPPSDGALSDAQLDRFVRVRRAASSRGRNDGEAARAVGVDPEEFSWVRARVAEALIEADARRVRTASEEIYARTIASLRETRRSVKDPATAKSIDDQISGLERERATFRRTEPVSPGLGANARKVAARRAEIDGPP